jgi:hypothetical protein
VIDRKAVARLDGRASAPRIEAMLEEHLAPVAELSSPAAS